MEVIQAAQSVLDGRSRAPEDDAVAAVYCCRVDKTHLTFKRQQVEFRFNV